MFKIAASPFYWYTVEIPFRLEGGKIEIRKIEAKFKRLSQKEVEDLLDPNQPPRKDRELLNDVMLDWKGVGDEGGAPLDFTPTNFDAFLGVIPVQSTLVKAFFQSMQGGARTGN